MTQLEKRHMKWILGDKQDIKKLFEQAKKDCVDRFSLNSKQAKEYERRRAKMIKRLLKTYD